MFKQLKILTVLVLMGSSWSAMAAPETPLWTASLEGNISSSVAIGSNTTAGILYVGTADGKVQAMNITTGAVVWKFTTAGYVGATPAVSADGTTVYAASYDKNLYAIDAATGAEKWRFTADSAIFASPVLDELGVIYLLSTNGVFYVIDPIEGAAETEFNLGISVDSSPAILSKASTTELFLGTENGTVIATNVDSGLVWTFTSDTGKAMSSPVLGPDNTVYIGSHDGYVYALNHADGTLKWKRQLNGRVASSLSIDKNTLYVASYDFGTLYALDMSTGAVWWEYQTNGVVFSTPAVSANGKLYIGTKTKLLAINETSGYLLWSYTTDSPVAASPVIGSNGNVYAITQNGALFALTGDSTTLAPSSWAMFRQNNSRNGMLRDADGDGLPDSWEAFFGITDASANGDGDSLTNLQEFLAGTLPTTTDTDGDGTNDSADTYPTHTGTPISFLALADRIVTRSTNPITIQGADLMVNDSNPNNITTLSITQTSDTVNTVNTRPTVTGGVFSLYTPNNSLTSNDEFSYTLSDGTNTRTGLVGISIAGSASNIVGTSNAEIVYAGGIGSTVTTDAGAGNDIIYDDADGDDTFLQGENDGQDRLIINDSSARNDVIKFEDSTASEINLYKDGADLIFNIRESNSTITVANALKNQALNGVTGVQFVSGSPWDMSKLIAVDDHIDLVATDDVITFTPDTVNLLTQNDFLPANVEVSLSVGSASGGTVAIENSYVDQHIVFTLTNSSVESGSFQYTLTDVADLEKTTTATVSFSVIDSDVEGITFDGNTDDNVLEGTAGNDTFNSSSGFDIINGIGGEDTINFGIGGDKDTFFYMWDDGGSSYLGDTINLTSLTRSAVLLERQGLDIVAKIKSTGESIRLQDHHWQEASINAAIGAANGLMPFKQVNFSSGTPAYLSGTGFTTTTSSDLVNAATDNATSTCTGAGANNLCIATSGNDASVSGGSGNDIVYGRAGNDTIAGNVGDDILYGELGADVLHGGTGNDELYGDQGNDWLNPGAGTTEANYLNGGSGRDYYQLSQTSGTNIIDNFDLTNGANESTKNILWFNGSYPSTGILRSNVTFHRIDDDLIVKVKVSTTESVNTVLNFFSFSGYNEVDAIFPRVVTSTGSGPIIWNGSCVDDTMTTQSLTGVAPEANVVDYYCIPVRVLYDMTHDDTCGNPALDDDVLTGYSGMDTINANCGNDIIHSGSGADIVNGGTGNDTIYPDWGGSDIVHGDGGDDDLHGNDYSSLYGDAGNDDYIFGENSTAVGYIYDAGPSTDTASKDTIQLINPGLVTHSYWMYVGDADSDSQSDDLIIEVTGTAEDGFQAAIINWNNTLSGGDTHQLDLIEVGTPASCLKINRSQLSAYMAAIVTAVGGNGKPTTTQMDTAIGSGTYWTTTTGCGG